MRLESRHEADPQRTYPICLDGDGSCPPEDCGGVPGFLARREAWIAPEAGYDFAVPAGFIDQLALKRSTGASIDAEEINDVQEALERLEVLRETHLIMGILHDSGLAGSLDLVELNPFLDERGRTALLMVDLVASPMGWRVLDRPTQSYRYTPRID